MVSSTPCQRHQRAYCYGYQCNKTDSASSSFDNAGAVTINSEGHLAIGLGGGLAIDPVDGSLGIQVGGFTIDTA